MTTTSRSHVRAPVPEDIGHVRSCSEPGCHAAVFAEGHATCAAHRLSQALHEVEEAVWRHMSPLEPSSAARISRAIVEAKRAGASPQEIQRVSALGRRRANRDAAARTEAALVAEQTRGYPETWL